MVFLHPNYFLKQKTKLHNRLNPIWFAFYKITSTIKPYFNSEPHFLAIFHHHLLHVKATIDYSTFSVSLES